MMNEIILSQEHECRLEISATDELKIKLISGSAECFGVELAIDRIYTFRDKKIAIFTWYGCTLSIDGQPDVQYTSGDTPMNSYINIHSQLQRRRELAKAKHSIGPKVLIAGPVDSGKSTLCQILLNYALRLDEKPTYVELDIGQGNLSVPGTISASPLDMNCLSVENNFAATNPLTFNFGHTSLSAIPELYRHQMKRLASCVEERMALDVIENASGCIVNTCGWVDGLGFDLLLDTIEIFDIDVVLVIGQDRLYSRLQSSLLASSLPNTSRKRETLSIVKLTRSDGVVPLDSKCRSSRRISRIREYFYGQHSLSRSIPTHSPCVNEYEFDKLHFYSIKDMKVSDAMLPVGQTEVQMQRLQAMPVEKSTENILHALCAVAHLPPSFDVHSGSTVDVSWLIDAPSAGYVFVKEVDEAEQKIILLVPSPGPLPSPYLLLGSVKWLE